jgi:hypothetical protein
MAEPLNATFFAFRKREKSGVLLGAAITYVVMLVLLLAAFGALFFAIGGQVASLADPQRDPDALQRLMSPGTMAAMALAYIGLLFCIFVLLAAFEAACLRWMIRGETKGLFGLALDEDTWRVYGIYWVWLLACVLGMIGLSLVLALLGQMITGTLLVLALPVVFLLVPIVLGVRLAPAAATAIAERKFAFFDAWKVSSDRFWALLGSFFLLYLIYFLVAGAISGGWMYWAYGPHLDAIMAAIGDPIAMSEAMSEAMTATLAAPGALPIYIGVQIISLIVGVTFYIALYGVNARAALVALEEGKIEPESAG